MKPQRMMVQDSPNRQWAGNCGCDGSCAFQFFNDDMELVDVRSKPETVFKALVQQLKQLTGFNAFQEDSSEDEDNNMLQMLLEAPRKSREAHWMHLQIDALMAQQETEEESHDWQKHWQEDYKQQIQVFEEFLSSEKLQEHLQILETSEKLEVLTAFSMREGN
ncbi:hypothetical protein GQ600_10143 [Phytophthora cactorum]|nr:hypothetical protein GQ600_10143 [Phytophthora cactorum]